MTFSAKVREAVGANVKAIRESIGKSVTECAEAARIHRSYWNYLENGHVNFTIDKLEVVAGVIGARVGDLFAEPETVFAQSGAPARKAKRPKRGKVA